MNQASKDADQPAIVNTQNSMDELTIRMNKEGSMAGGNILAASAASRASVYFDAYTGEDDVDKVTE